MVTYNTSRAAVVRMKRYLSDMEIAKKTITWPASDPRKRAYQIREALAAATHYPEYERFHELKNYYRISARQGWVEAEYLGIDEEGVPIKTYVPERLTVSEVIDVHGVVGACIKFGPKANEIYFPAARISEEDKHDVWKWGQTMAPHWKLIDHEKEGVTMTRKDDVAEMFLWRPKTEEADDGE